ncbi:MAG: hypothetical protein GY809_05235, partial [Planctomycetes bacterium]|nr:hypothetical protein [Planctomycetota bacterium]
MLSIRPRMSHPTGAAGRCLAVSLLILCSLLAHPAMAADPPNIVIILVDDMG